MNASTLKSRIRALRIFRGLTTDELAQRVGKTRQAVEHWESGRRTPPLKTIVRIADVLGVQLELQLVPGPTQDLDSHAVEVLLRLASVLRRVPENRRGVLVAQVEEMEQVYPDPHAISATPQPETVPAPVRRRPPTR